MLETVRDKVGLKNQSSFLAPLISDFPLSALSSYMSIYVHVCMHAQMYVGAQVCEHTCMPILLRDQESGADTVV